MTLILQPATGPAAGDRRTRKRFAALTAELGRLARRRAKLGRALVAALVSMGIAVPHAAQAFEPVTCAIVASAVIGAMNKPHNIDGARIEEILNQLAALGYSVETIQNGIAELLVRTQDLDGKMTASAVKAAEAMTLKAVVARSENLKGLVDEAEKFGKGSFKDGSPKWPAYRADIRRIALSLREDRQNLVMMPVTSIPGLILATYVEMHANQVSEFGEGNAEVLKLAVAQLERTIDDMPDSLPSLIADRRERLARTEAEIAKLVGLPDPKVEAGVRPWFAHTLLQKVDGPEQCREFFGHRMFIDAPPDVRCWKTKVDAPLHSRAWSRRIDVTPATGGSADLRNIAVVPVPPAEETPGSLAGAPGHLNSDQDYENAVFTDKTLENALERHRTEVAAIVELERLEGLVRRTLANLAVVNGDPASWSPDEALSLVGQASVALAGVDSVAARQTTKAHLGDFEKSQKNLRWVQEEGRERIEALIRENRSKAWMSDVQFGLQLYAATAPLAAQFARALSAPAVPSISEGILRKPELGESVAKKPVEFGLRLGSRPSSAKTPGFPTARVDPVRFGDSMGSTVRFALLGPGAERAYSLGLGSPSNPQTGPAPEAYGAALQDAMLPTRHFPAIGGTAGEIATARAWTQASRFGFSRDLGGLFDPLKLYRGLLGDKGVEDFFKREIAPRQKKLDETLSDYQARAIADTLRVGDREKLLADVAFQYRRLENFQLMIGLKTVDQKWLAENVVAQEIVRGLELPASLARTEEQHAMLVDKVYRELQAHPHRTYGAPSREEIDWQIRYAGRLLPPPPRSAN